jgi:uncharacterized protein
VRIAENLITHTNTRIGVYSLRVALLLALVLSTSACTQFLFQPLKPLIYSPDAVHLKYNDIYAVDAQGLRLHGWVLHAKGKHVGSLIFFHGNGDNISTQFANVYWLADHGYDVYLFDYRGYGKSEGVPGLDGIISDYDVMLKAVLQKIPKDEKLIVMGHSFGASLSIYGVAHSHYRNRIAALISVEAFSDYHEITQEVLSRSWLTWALQWPLSFTIDNSYRPLDSVTLISPIPLLIMQSKQDRIVELHHAKDLYAAAKPPRSLIVMQEGDHNHIFNVKQNRELLLGYLAGLSTTTTKPESVSEAESSLRSPLHQQRQ